jgi:hypothetical protein
MTNSCVKTGFSFVIENELNRVYRGDLFFNDLTGFHIKGVPMFYFNTPTEPKGVTDAVIKDTAIFLSGETSLGRGYFKHSNQIELVRCTDDFRRHIHQWYPPLECLLPSTKEYDV